MPIEIPYNFNPRSYQREIWEADARGIRRFYTIWHRRAGKDKSWLNFMFQKMCERAGNYYYVLPTYAQAKKIVWDGIDRNEFKVMDHIPSELVQNKQNVELKVELKNGSIFQLLGSDNMDRIVGINAAGVVFSEYSLQMSAAWDYFRPIINENDGWAAFNFTPRGRGENPGWKLYNLIKDDPKWWGSIKTVNDTRRDAQGEDLSQVVSAEQIDQDRKEGMDEELVQQEYYCSFNGSTSGSYYGKLMEQLVAEGRLTDVAWDPTHPVATAWDLGVADAMVVIFFQVIGPRINIIDHIEKRGEGLAYFAGEISSRKYVYSRHYAPHDIQARELSTGKSRLDVARDLGLDFDLTPNVPVQDGIDALRAIFGRLWIDRRCSRLVECLAGYHKAFDLKNSVFHKQPVHDWSSDSADAARYLALVYDREYEDRHALVTSAGMDQNPYETTQDEGLDADSFQ